VTQPKPSKSARKREQLELQALGEQLIGLSADELSALPIDERLREAVIAAAKIRSHGALRRQKQLIGKLMRHCDPEPIRHAWRPALPTNARRSASSPTRNAGATGSRLARMMPSRRFAN